MTEFQRYVLNGLAATAVHYAVLMINMDLLNMPSAGIANLIAACFGIAASFLGNRYFVFAGTSAPLHNQAAKFVLLYGVIAIIHGGILYLWTDLAGLPYSWGFLLATVVQFLCSYLGNKLVVFVK